MDQTEFERLSKPARVQTTEERPGPPRTTVITITDTVTPEEVQALLAAHVAPSLHPSLTEYQREHALARLEELFWSSAAADSTTVFDLLQSCARQAASVRPTVDDDGNPMDPKKLEKLKAKEKKGDE